MSASCWEALQAVKLLMGFQPWALHRHGGRSLTGLLGRAHGAACCYSPLRRGAGSQFGLVSTLNFLSPGRDEVLLRDRSL